MRYVRVAQALCVGAMLLAGVSCSRRSEQAAAPAPVGDTAAARAIVRDRPERLVLPLAPAGAGQVTYRSVAALRALLDPPAGGRVEPATAALDLPPPAAEVAEPPAAAAPAPDPALLELKPPIPRGNPQLLRSGRGGIVTLDVRVDESGEVSDVQLVETDADSLTVLAVSNAALALRYYPALLGTRHVAVWTRQVFQVAPGRERRP